MGDAGYGYGEGLHFHIPVHRDLPPRRIQDQQGEPERPRPVGDEGVNIPRPGNRTSPPEGIGGLAPFRGSGEGDSPVHRPGLGVRPDGPLQGRNLQLGGQLHHGERDGSRAQKKVLRVPHLHPGRCRSGGGAVQSRLLPDARRRQGRLRPRNPLPPEILRRIGVLHFRLHPDVLVPEKGVLFHGAEALPLHPFLRSGSCRAENRHGHFVPRHLHGQRFLRQSLPSRTSGLRFQDVFPRLPGEEGIFRGIRGFRPAAGRLSLQGPHDEGPFRQSGLRPGLRFHFLPYLRLRGHGRDGQFRPHHFYFDLFRFAEGAVPVQGNGPDANRAGFGKDGFRPPLLRFRRGKGDLRGRLEPEEHLHFLRSLRRRQEFHGRSGDHGACRRTHPPKRHGRVLFLFPGCVRRSRGPLRVRDHPDTRQDGPELGKPLSGELKNILGRVFPSRSQQHQPGLKREGDLSLDDHSLQVRIPLVNTGGHRHIHHLGTVHRHESLVAVHCHRFLFPVGAVLRHLFFH